jgi:hypothetical protein
MRMGTVVHVWVAFCIALLIVCKLIDPTSITPANIFGEMVGIGFTYLALCMAEKRNRRGFWWSLFVMFSPGPCCLVLLMVGRKDRLAAVLAVFD